ncbi:TOMM precursor leader peptide-binding protein [Leifsonia sp. ZF2019]|uniref:TOMM precursor leader peptide-binding protein n=1 Tax=Leifsonia sp. ZF2019 TaxID=2781978 RepID=UPI001CBBC8CB|nr:TOMM precursor leader peptide-binding protein [Leifsonia sp. ZF2019]UAJ80960.1 TOMM precursor leader peptide-binding protein [Leifsonia sp. ZF2019]
MVLAIDPRIPRVWRSPDALQFGVDAPVLVLEPVSPAEERMIAALADGVSMAGLRMIAKRSRVEQTTVDALLARLHPVLDRPDDRAAATPFVALDGDGPTAARVVGHLRDGGAEVAAGLSWSDPRVEAAAFAVLVGSYAIEPSRHGKWLRRDVPHLPVVFGEKRVVVGPVVHPGRGACVRCLDLHRRDADPAWPALATQLHSRTRPGESRLVVEAVASVTAAIALAVVGARAVGRGRAVEPQPARSTSFDPATGRWSTAEHMPHPECGCLALPLSRPMCPADAPAGPVRRGSATAAGRPDVPAGSLDATS